MKLLNIVRCFSLLTKHEFGLLDIEAKYQLLIFRPRHRKPLGGGTLAQIESSLFVGVRSPVAQVGFGPLFYPFAPSPECLVHRLLR
jgi:hypothetical protein